MEDCVLFTIVKDFRQEIVIEKSRFICTLKKVNSEAEAQEFIKAIKKEFWDATHNCSAYIVDEMAQRSSDDGEPSGTAGLPMLEVLRKNKLTNTAAVVSRYFGGIKLGAGGLVRAYTNSVAEAVRATGIAQKVLVSRFSFMYDLNDVGKILNILYQQQLFEIADVEYGLQAKVILKMKDSDKETAEAWLTESLNKVVQLEREGSEFIEVPL
ncbi:MAG: YigZ family protein [Phascolarctobacterium sp.]|nr:YigZ family protein [Phascolarctobacterium sp.]MBQ3541006.1 YigZ family protein [Phascolarctobacterium sp.]MBQ7021089.1 YigZ family protein [Phascolarctobacterium sp.]